MCSRHAIARRPAVAGRSALCCRTFDARRANSNGCLRLHLLEFVPTTLRLQNCAVVYSPFHPRSAVWLLSDLGTIGRRLSAVEFWVTCVQVKVAPLSQVVPR